MRMASVFTALKCPDLHASTNATCNEVCLESKMGEAACDAVLLRDLLTQVRRWRSPMLSDAAIRMKTSLGRLHRRSDMPVIMYRYDLQIYESLNGVNEK